MTIDYGDKYLVGFYELTKYCSFSGSVAIDHQRRLCRSRWLSDLVTNSVPRGIKYCTIVCIAHTIVRALTECLSFTYLTAFPISCHFLLTSLAHPCCGFIQQLGICPGFRMFMKFERGLFFKGGQVWTLASKKYPGQHGDGRLSDFFYIVSHISGSRAPIVAGLFLGCYTEEPVEPHVYGLESPSCNVVGYDAQWCCVIGLHRSWGLLVSHFLEDVAC